MPTRKNTPVTAEKVLDQVSMLLTECQSFFQSDLTVLVFEVLKDLEGNPRDRSTSPGEDHASWESRFKLILRWTSLALREQQWLENNGLPQPNFSAAGVRRHGTMSTFIRQEELPDNSSTAHALQQGRKVLRLETAIGVGISLLLVPVLPMIRRLTDHELSRLVQILASSDYQNIKVAALDLCQLRYDYQGLYGIQVGRLCLAALFTIANALP